MPVVPPRVARSSELRLRFVASVGWVGLVLAACLERPLPHVPEAGGSRAVASENARCVSCHVEEGREWASSNHALSFRHETFQAALAIEPLPFCVSCHAPLSLPTAPSREAELVGVGCVSCHTFTAGKADRVSEAKCVACHEFPFPGSSRLLQRTATERASANIRASCIECHMRPVFGGARRHTDHRVLASRDAELVRSAASIEARRDGEWLVVVFRRSAAGHAFPTGDVFRRLKVVVVADGARRVVVLGRHVTRDGETDTRPFADGSGETVARAFVGSAERVTYEVLYERVAHPVDHSGIEAVVDGKVELAWGELPPFGPRSSTLRKEERRDNRPPFD